MRYTEKKGSSKDSSNRQQNDKLCLDFSGNFFLFLLGIIATSKKTLKDEICCARYTMHFNAEHCILSKLPKKNCQLFNFVVYKRSTASLITGASLLGCCSF